MADKVYAILLAAGLSQRFGKENKLLMPFHGKALAQYTIDLIRNLSAEFFDGIFLVYSDNKVAALADSIGEAGNIIPSPHRPITLIYNKAPEKGQGESVRLGVEAAHACEDDFLFFFPCDQPFLDADTVRRIFAARRKGCIVEPYCVSTCDNLGNQDKSGACPCLFSGVFRDELLFLPQGEAPRVIKVRHNEAVIRVEVSNPLVLSDIDFREIPEGT